jgi:hypothetical protein
MERQLSTFAELCTDRAASGIENVEGHRALRPKAACVERDYQPFREHGRRHQDFTVGGRMQAGWITGQLDGLEGCDGAGVTAAHGVILAPRLLRPK